MTIPDNSYKELAITHQKNRQTIMNSGLNYQSVLNQKLYYTNFFLANVDRKVCRNVDALIVYRIIQLKTLCENKYFKLIKIDSQHAEIDISQGLRILENKKSEFDLELLTDLIKPLMQIIASNHFDLNCPSLQEHFISPLIGCLEREVLYNLWERSKLLMLMNRDAPQEVHNEIIKKMIS